MLKSGLGAWCKACHSDWSTERRSRPGYRQEALNRQYRALYGITYEEVIAMWGKQGQACAICGVTEGLGKNNWPSVDHCHITGKVRGLLCHGCNTFLGFARENIATLARAIVYLEESKDGINE